MFKSLVNTTAKKVKTKEHSPHNNLAQARFLDLATYGLGLLLVLLISPRGFSLATDFPLFSKTSMCKFQIPNSSKLRKDSKFQQAQEFTAPQNARPYNLRKGCQFDPVFKTNRFQNSVIVFNALKVT